MQVLPSVLVGGRAASRSGFMACQATAWLSQPPSSHFLPTANKTPGPRGLLTTRPRPLPRATSCARSWKSIDGSSARPLRSSLQSNAPKGWKACRIEHVHPIRWGTGGKRCPVSTTQTTMAGNLYNQDSTLSVFIFSSSLFQFSLLPACLLASLA